jgi:hypothetical protein
MTIRKTNFVPASSIVPTHMMNAELTEITGHGNPLTSNGDTVMDDGKRIIGSCVNIMMLMHVVFVGAVGHEKHHIKNIT